jgi:hypothetical protein
MTDTASSRTSRTGFQATSDPALEADADVIGLQPAAA